MVNKDFVAIQQRGNKTLTDSINGLVLYLKSVRITTVSYTHLDVYKRQAECLYLCPAEIPE